jgi:hypothetical protein
VTTRQTNALILALLIAATGGFLYWTSRAEQSARAQVSPVERTLEAAPAETFLVATLDVAKLRGSPLLAPLQSLGAGLNKEVTHKCGFDPLERLDALTVAVPEDEGSGDFGLAMAGRLSTNELVTCGQKVMEDRGAVIATEHVGSFTLAYDKATVASLNRFGKLALREGGPYLLARGEWLETMIASAEQKHPRATSNTRHMALRTALDAEHRALVATVLLPAKLRDRLKREMAGEAPNSTMRGILGVESAGIALGAGGEVAAELRCETADDCNEVKALLLAKRDAWSRDLGMRILGVGALLQNVNVDVRETTLSVRSQLPVEEAGRLLSRILEMRSRPAAPAAPSSSAPPLPRPRADEVLSPRKDGGISRTSADGGPR